MHPDVLNYIDILNKTINPIICRAWDEKQQQKAHAVAPTQALSPPEAAYLLVLLDDVNTIVKHVSIDKYNPRLLFNIKIFDNTRISMALCDCFKIMINSVSFC